MLGRFKIKIPLFIISLLIIFTVPAYALSSNYFVNAKAYYQKECLNRPTRINGEKAVLCYSFDKLGEISNTITNLQNIVNENTSSIATIESEVEELREDNLLLINKLSEFEARIASLEGKLVVEESKVVYFAQYRPQPFDSVWIDTTGFSLIKINLSITGGISQYDVHYSSDKVSYTNQGTVNCFGSYVCSEATFAIQARYYRISTGTANGNVTSTGLLYN